LKEILLLTKKLPLLTKNTLILTKKRPMSMTDGLGGTEIRAVSHPPV
jgi:hypothetical protein